MKKSKIKIPFNQTLKILAPYISSKVKYQAKAVSVIVLYLLFFQLFILGIPVRGAINISWGIILVVIGLAFFLEGLIIGIMPLGEYSGKQIPVRVPFIFILLFAFFIGFAATLAEPAIAVLSAAGSMIAPWESPLLFGLLNGYSTILVYSICIGVGVAVLFGVLRFMYKWSLKPFIFIIIPVLLVASLLALFRRDLTSILGLAWDSGGITTGPVTVPLVLALGIGISRVISSSEDSTSGFGVVTLASSFPIISVLIAGFVIASYVPPEGSIDSFHKNKKAVNVFGSVENYIGSYLTHCSADTIEILNMEHSINQDELIDSFIKNPDLFREYFKTIDDLERWTEKFPGLYHVFNENRLQFQIDNKGKNLLSKNFILAVRAVLPLSLFLLLILIFLPSDTAPRKDEIALGIVISIIGMTLFTIGIERGLSNLGNQVGITLPATFETIKVYGETKIIKEFDESLVIRSTTSGGTKREFFYLEDKSGIKQIPYNRDALNKETGEYFYTPQAGPLGGGNKNFGFVLLIIFAFFMGYSVTLAEPALNALGITLEEITVGTFTRTLLIQAVAIGVGIGMSFGILRIIFNIDLIYLLAPPYIILLILSLFSDETFLNIAWDSGGVTTGPVTVPLVIAMGLGVGRQIGVSDGFGILALSSCFPILTVLILGLIINHKQKLLLNERFTDGEKTGAEIIGADNEII